MVTGRSQRGFARRLARHTYHRNRRLDRTVTPILLKVRHVQLYVQDESSICLPVEQLSSVQHKLHSLL